ncbi:UNVERIFIED_CONTAM: Transcription factor [Sesamum radiatum]|uniref:Transcription factor n=1 Tax=Sesamum radiatum TaxID=300843 RepID=A0AAW2LNC0_SESRA
MEDEFQFQIQPPPLLLSGEAASAVDEAYMNGVCAGLSFRSLLTYGSLGPGAETGRYPFKMPKTEPLFAVNDGIAAEAPPYNFFSEAASSSLHHQLPGLLSLELPQNTAVVESPMMNPRIEAAPYGKQRRRRQQQRLSDKTRCLQKLLPWDEKMDMATVLEEAYKYIRFLQAQVRVLQSMPCESAGGGAATASCGTTASIGCGDLGRLNRQQLLQVVVNSPVAQTQLYSKGCCLYSVEQLVLLKKNAERKALYHQMMLESSNPNPFLS